MVGNGLAQHRELSFTARGIALYIQSLPAGSPIGVKTLAGLSTEGEIRVASALRELEEHGYLQRRRERLATGQMVTRTYSYNSPGAALRQPPLPPPPDEKPVRRPEPLPEAKPEPLPEPKPVPAPAPEPVAEPAPVLAPVPAPEAAGPAAPVRQEAVDLLARLRSEDPRLLLADRDVRKLAPGVSAWLERGASPEAVRHVLAADLPADLRHSAALIAYRLRTQLPPHLPAARAARPARRPDPLQNCDGCERAFRAPEPGRCRDCPPDAETAAA
ncbi:helix-turn-helix domain-containing protein [Streptomyces sp. LARHCF249]